MTKFNEIEKHTAVRGGFRATVILDSVSLEGVRLTTMEVRMPRIILAEWNTHRALSRNAASSRAIPVKRMIQQVIDDPFIPVHWGKNRPGMQATEEMTEAEKAVEIADWLEDRDYAVKKALGRMERGLHKQVANRPLEPWMWTTVVVTATEWSNFYALRDHADAQPEMRVLADVMLAAHNASEPFMRSAGGYHLPYVSEDDLKVLIREAGSYAAAAQRAHKWSVARCARVSTLNHDGTNPDPVKDEALHDALMRPGHMSPFEHQATPCTDPEHFSGNLRGWIQYRKTIPGENRKRHARYAWDMRGME